MGAQVDVSRSSFFLAPPLISWRHDGNVRGYETGRSSRKLAGSGRGRLSSSSKEHSDGGADLPVTAFKNDGVRCEAAQGPGPTFTLKRS
jgi:hypothetical protein